VKQRVADHGAEQAELGAEEVVINIADVGELLDRRVRVLRVCDRTTSEPLAYCPRHWIVSSKDLVMCRAANAPSGVMSAWR
ncbi:hypothetical protein B8W95_13485, partial [Staphylococcus pasteuri]